MGVRTAPTAILRVEERDGKILWEPEVKENRVMDPEHAWLILDALRDVVRRGTAYGNVTGRGFTVPAGGKTGTTNDGMDVWFVGFTPELVTGVWMGFDKKTRIKGNAQGGLLAAPAWTMMMKEVSKRLCSLLKFLFSEIMEIVASNRLAAIRKTMLAMEAGVPFCSLSKADWDSVKRTAAIDRIVRRARTG